MVNSPTPKWYSTIGFDNHSRISESFDPEAGAAEVPLPRDLRQLPGAADLRRARRLGLKRASLVGAHRGGQGFWCTSGARAGDTGIYIYIYMQHEYVCVYIYIYDPCFFCSVYLGPASYTIVEHIMMRSPGGLGFQLLTTWTLVVWLGGCSGGFRQRGFIYVLTCGLALAVQRPEGLQDCH